jgi:hypothetical protein
MVTARAKARWDAMLKDDLDTAYGYMSPASRQVTSLDKYKANTRRGAFATRPSTAWPARATRVR